MRAAVLLLTSLALGATSLAGACLNEGHAPDPPGTETRACLPSTEGFDDATTFLQPPFSLPAGCRILEDDRRVAIFRRQVVEIDDRAELEAACDATAAIPDAGLSPFDGGSEAPPIDFATYRLLVVRIPDTTAPRWSLRRGDEIILGESSAICTGIDPQPRRYLQLVPRTATVTFHLCEPEGCEEEG